MDRSGRASSRAAESSLPVKGGVFRQSGGYLEVLVLKHQFAIWVFGFGARMKRTCPSDFLLKANPNGSEMKLRMSSEPEYSETSMGFFVFA
ncbi:hypothetical protein PS2_025530 [Malus domestica]